MKNLILFLILGTFLVSCDGCDPINPPIPPVTVIKQFTITTVCGLNGTINPSSLVVDSTKDATLTLIPDAGYIVDVLKVDGKVVPSTTSLVLSNVTCDKKVEATFKIKFKEGSLSWYLVQKPWYRDSIIIHEDNGTWTHYKLWGVKDELQEVITFYPNGKSETYWNGKLVGDVTWTINETTNPPTFDDNYTIEKLDENCLILGDKVNNGFRDIYSHH